MDSSCVCVAKETAKNRLQSREVQVGHIRLVTIFTENDHDSDDFCVNVCNSDYIPPSDNENQFIHFTYLPFLRLIKWMKHLHEMLRISTLTKLKLTANFDDEDKQRNISISFDKCESVFVVHCNGQKLLIDEFAIETLMAEVVSLPKFVDGCRETYKKRQQRISKCADWMIRNWLNN